MSEMDILRLESNDRHRKDQVEDLQERVRKLERDADPEATDCPDSVMDRTWRLKCGDERRYTLDGSELDELAVGDWLHIEQMSEDSFWVRIGEVHFDLEWEDGKTKVFDYGLGRVRNGSGQPTPKRYRLRRCAEVAGRLGMLPHEIRPNWKRLPHAVNGPLDEGVTDNLDEFNAYYEPIPDEGAELTHDAGWEVRAGTLEVACGTGFAWTAEAEDERGDTVCEIVYPGQYESDARKADAVAHRERVLRGLHAALGRYLGRAGCEPIPDEGDGSELWAEFADTHCGLCGNIGVIDTRGRVFTASGVECGVRWFCICPNGRAWKDGGSDLSRLRGPTDPPDEGDADDEDRVESCDQCHETAESFGAAMEEQRKRIAELEQEIARVTEHRDEARGQVTRLTSVPDMCHRWEPLDWDQGATLLPYGIKSGTALVARFATELERDAVLDWRTRMEVLLRDLEQCRDQLDKERGRVADLEHNTAQLRRALDEQIEETRKERRRAEEAEAKLAEERCQIDDLSSENRRLRAQVETLTSLRETAMKREAVADCERDEAREELQSIAKTVGGDESKVLIGRVEDLVRERDDLRDRLERRRAMHEDTLRLCQSLEDESDELRQQVEQVRQEVKQAKAPLTGGVTLDEAVEERMRKAWSRAGVTDADGVTAEDCARRMMDGEGAAFAEAAELVATFVERARRYERKACRGEALKELGKEASPLTASRIASRIRGKEQT